MKDLLQSQFRQTLLNAVINAGNPELFIWILLVEAHIGRQRLSDIAKNVQEHVHKVGHPILITLVALMQNEETAYSPAIRHYALRHRLERCLAYFPLLKTKLRLPNETPKITREVKLKSVTDENFKHLVLALCGIKEWNSQDVNTCSRLTLTEENRLLGLEYYFFHYGDYIDFYPELEKANIAKMTLAEINAWVGLLMAAGKMTYILMHRVLSHQQIRQGNAELLAQCLIQKDEYLIAGHLTNVASISTAGLPLRIHPVFKKQLQQEIDKLFPDLNNRVINNLHYPFWLKWIGILLMVVMTFTAFLMVSERLVLQKDISFTMHIINLVVGSIGLFAVLSYVAYHLIPDFNSTYDMATPFAFRKHHRENIHEDLEKLIDRLSAIAATKNAVVSDVRFYHRMTILFETLKKEDMVWQWRFNIYYFLNRLKPLLTSVKFDSAPYALNVRQSEAHLRSMFFAIQRNPNDIVSPADDKTTAKELEAKVLTY